MSTRPYDEFAFNVTDTLPEADRQPDLILPPGYVDAIDPATGKVVAVRIQEQPQVAVTPPPAPTAGPTPEQVRPLTDLERALKYAAAQPAPIPAEPLPQVQGLNPVIWQGAVVVGVVSLATLPVGAAIWIACDGLHNAGPWFHDASQFLIWLVIVLVTMVTVLVILARKAKAAMASAGAEGGKVVNALFFRHTEVHVGKQSAGWKGSVNNNLQ